MGWDAGRGGGDGSAGLDVGPRAVREHVAESENKIVFDKFHIAQHLGEAVDRVRRREHKQLKAEGDDRLTEPNTTGYGIRLPSRANRSENLRNCGKAS